MSTQLSPEETENQRLLNVHLDLLRTHPGDMEMEDVRSVSGAPILSMPVLEHIGGSLNNEGRANLIQYGLLAGLSEPAGNTCNNKSSETPDPRIFFNITAPSSTFICGSQGSGKSHTLSCLLENCLFLSDVNNLPNPPTGIIFHYDKFISDLGGSPCEAAFLSSNTEIKVRVLCSPTNIATIKAAYSTLKNVTIEPLHINQTDLNTKRMLDLMAGSREDGPMPLYLHSVYRILREIRIEQQQNGTSFNYQAFKMRLEASAMTPAQLAPLHQRLDTLESFMPQGQTTTIGIGKKGKKGTTQHGNSWKPEAGSLTIVDLSCPCITPEGACSLFNICLSIFLEQDMKMGRVIALDKAHKYMNTSSEASTLTNTLLAIIRLQRHLGARAIISTQEPTISPALLDLSSLTIVHGFTSPEWFRTLRQHLAGASSVLENDEPTSDSPY